MLALTILDQRNLHILRDAKQPYEQLPATDRASNIASVLNQISPDVLQTDSNDNLR